MSAKPLDKKEARAIALNIADSARGNDGKVNFMLLMSGIEHELQIAYVRGYDKASRKVKSDE